MDDDDDALTEEMRETRITTEDSDDSEEGHIEIEDMEKEKREIDENIIDIFRGVLNATQENLNEETKTSILIIKATYSRVLRTQSEELEAYFFSNLQARYQALFPIYGDVNVDNALRMLPRAAVIIHAYEDQPFIVDFLINDCEQCLLHISKEIHSNCLMLLGRLLEWSIRIGRNKHVLYPVERQRIIKNLLLFSRAREYEVRIACIKGLAAVQDEPVDPNIAESPKDALTNMLQDPDWRVRCAVISSITFVDTRFRDKVIYMAQDDEQAEIVVAAMNRLSKEDPFDFKGEQLYEALFGTLMDKNGNVRKLAQEQLATSWISQIIKESNEQRGRKPTKNKLDGIAFGIFMLLREFSPTILTRYDQNCRIIIRRILEFYHNAHGRARVNEFVRDLLAGCSSTDIVISSWSFRKIIQLPLKDCYPAIFFWRVLVEYVKQCAKGNDAILLDGLSRLSPTLKETAFEVDRLFTSTFSQFLVRDELEDSYDQCWITIFIDFVTVLGVLDKDDSGMETYRKLLLQMLTNMVVTRNLVELAVQEYIESFLQADGADEKQFVAALWGDVIYHLEAAIDKWYTINNIERQKDERGVSVLEDEPLGHAFMVLNAMIKTHRFAGIRQFVHRTLQRYDAQPTQMIVAGMDRKLAPTERDIAVIYIELMAALSMQFPEDYETYVPLICTVAYQIKDDAILHQTLIVALTDVILMSNYQQVLDLANSEENMLKREDVPFDFIDYLNDALRSIPLDIDVGDYENSAYECACKFVLHQPKIVGIHRLLTTMIARVMHPECFERPCLRSMLMSFFEIFRGDIPNQRLMVEALFDLFDQISGTSEEELPNEWTKLISEIVPEKVAAFVTFSISAENLQLIVSNERAINKGNEDLVKKRRSSLPDDPNKVISVQLVLLSRAFDQIYKEIHFLDKNGLDSLYGLGDARYELIATYAHMFRCVNTKYGFTQKALLRLKQRVEQLKTDISALAPPTGVAQSFNAFIRSAEARLRQLINTETSPSRDNEDDQNADGSSRKTFESDENRVMSKTRTPRNTRSLRKKPLTAPQEKRSKATKSDRQKINELMSVPSTKRPPKVGRTVQTASETPRRQQPPRAARRAPHLGTEVIPEEENSIHKEESF